jgi:hypothetical protein
MIDLSYAALAVRGLENISSSLAVLDEVDQQELRSEIFAIAAASNEESYQRAVMAIPDMLGLAGGASPV